MQQVPYILLSSLFIVTPLIFSPRSSELFEFPKMLFIYFIAALLLPFILLTKTQEQKKHTAFIVVVLAVFLFLASQLASTWFSIDVHTSIFGYYSRFNGGLMSLAAYLVIAYSAYLFIDAKKISQFLSISLGGAAVVSVWGLPSKFGYDLICLFAQGTFNTSCWTTDFRPTERLFSTLGQPNWLAGYLLIHIFITLYFIAIRHKLLNTISERISVAIYLCLFTLFSVELIWTQSRSAILSYIVFVPIFLTYYFYHHRNALKNKKNLALIGVFLFVFIYAVIQITPFVRELKRLSDSKKVTRISPTLKNEQDKTPSQEGGITPSSSIRTIVWSGALALGKQYPLFGTGVETFAYSYNFVRPSAHNKTSEWNYVYNKAHNEVLNYFATSGYLGVVSYLFMIAVFVWIGGRLFFHKDDHQKIYGVFYVSSIASLFVIHLFGFSTTTTHLFLFTLPALTLTFSKKEHAEPLRFTGFHLFFSATWVLLVGIYIINYLMADYYFARGREQKLLGNISESYAFTQKALIVREEPVYMDQQSYILSQIGSSLKLQKQATQAAEFVRQAIEMNDKTLESSPKNVYFYNTRAKIFYLLHLTYLEDEKKGKKYLDEAISALRQAQKLAPTDPKIPYMMAAFILDEDTKEAVRLLNRSIDLKPDYTPARELLEKSEELKR